MKFWATSQILHNHQTIRYSDNAEMRSGLVLNWRTHDRLVVEGHLIWGAQSRHNSVPLSIVPFNLLTCLEYWAIIRKSDCPREKRFSKKIEQKQ
jgi:hypothetical protein